MATALFSGCDVLTNVGGIAATIANTTYANTGAFGSVGPPAGTKMSFVGKYADVIGATEKNQLLAAGLSLFMFYENSSLQHNSPAADFPQGVSDGTAAKNSLSALAMWPMPVYFAIDFDVSSNDVGLYWFSYFEGIINAIGLSNTGMYGSVAAWQQINNQLALDGIGSIKYFCQSRSSGWRGNGNFVSGQTLWQWPPAYSPSGNLVIGGIGVDGEFAYASDFGQWPRPSTPPGGGGGGTGVVAFGQQSTANAIINSTFTQPDRQNVIIPKETYDEVIYSNTFTDTTSVGNTVGSYSINVPTSGTIPSFPIGTYSFDNGASWNDFGFIFSGDFGAFPGTLPPVVLQAVVDSNGKLSFNAAVNQQVGSGSKIPLIINVALLYAPTIASSAVVPSVTQALAYGSGNAATTYASYRRIFKDSSVGTGATTVAHGQSGIPNIVFWGYDTSNNILTQPSVWASGGAVTTQIGISMDTTNVYFNVDTGLSKVYYRIFKDN